MLSFKIHPVQKNSLFFNNYQYSARFNLNELGVIRGLDLDNIDQIVKERNEWRREHRGIYAGYRQQITAEDVERLKQVGELLKQYKSDIKFTISYHTGYVYTNNIKVITQLNELDFIQHFRVQQAVEICPVGTIALKNPCWTHRTYFRSRQLSDIQRQTLIEYLKSRENIRLGPGLRGWMNNKTLYWNSWTQDYFFFDHNNDGEVLFLNMVHSRITGRTLQIVAK